MYSDIVLSGFVLKTDRYKMKIRLFYNQIFGDNCPFTNMRFERDAISSLRKCVSTQRMTKGRNLLERKFILNSSYAIHDGFSYTALEHEVHSPFLLQLDFNK